MLAAILLVLLALQAPVPPQSPASATAPGSIEGRVQNAISSDAVAGATIEMICIKAKVVNTACSTQSTTPRPDGTFEFDSVIPGSYLPVA